jgi:hypothetical protein
VNARLLKHTKLYISSIVDTVTSTSNGTIAGSQYKNWIKIIWKKVYYIQIVIEKNSEVGS